LIADIDICERTGGIPNKILTIDKPVLVSDGYLTIEAIENDPRVDNPKLSAIEIRSIGKHYSHAITGGPYTAVDSDGDGIAVVLVNGKESHTHGPGESLASFVWKRGSTVVGNGENTTLSLPIGEHIITLTVTDTSGDENTDTTTVSVLPETFPEIISISPNTGSITGGTVVTITGSGFNSVASVQFGLTKLSRQEITVHSSNIITLVSPMSALSLPVPISVITPAGESNSKLFSYLSSIPVQFVESKLISFEEPTAIAFGPDSKLYVGSYNGKLVKFTLNDSFDTVISSVVTTVERYRGIYGIAFDPLDDADTPNPTVYITTSDIYHDEAQNSFGDAINGKVLAVSGANLDVVNEIVTGLPVSSADHSVSIFVVAIRAPFNSKNCLISVGVPTAFCK
jgi:IPT/TIG domain